MITPVHTRQNYRSIEVKNISKIFKYKQKPILNKR